MPGQGKHQFCLHLPGVHCRMSQRGASSLGDGEPRSTAAARAARRAGEELGKGFAESSWGSRGSAALRCCLFVLSLKKKILSEETPQPHLVPCRVHEDTLDFLSCALWDAAVAAIRGPWSCKPRSDSSSDPPSLCGKCVQHGVLDPSTHWEMQLSPCWVRGSPGLSAPVSSPARRSLSSTPAPHIQLAFSTKFVFTLKYSPLALNLLHSGCD